MPLDEAGYYSTFRDVRTTPARTNASNYGGPPQRVAEINDLIVRCSENRFDWRSSDPLYLRAEVPLCLPHIVIRLHRVPSAWSCSERLGQPQIHIRTNPGSGVEHARESDAGDSETLGGFGHTDAREPLTQHVARVWGGCGGA